MEPDDAVTALSCLWTPPRGLSGSDHSERSRFIDLELCREYQTRYHPAKSLFCRPNPVHAFNLRVTVCRPNFEVKHGGKT